MKNLLIASYDMEVGGVERSLISMLNHFDYNNYKVDLMLYSHSGDFMSQVPNSTSLLAEQIEYKTVRMPIREIFNRRKYSIGLARLYAKYKANLKQNTENGYRQLQYMWKYSLPFLPKLEEKYDVAISYLWPHHFVAHKVIAKTKIAWIHTDYSTVETDEQQDLQVWKEFDYILAVSNECKKAFLYKYPILEDKVFVMENILSPKLIREMSNEKIANPLLVDKRFKIITVARLSHAKGIDKAVEALHLLTKRGYQDIVWYVVGYGGDEIQIKKLIKKYHLEKQFILLGKKTNPYPFIKEADLYVQPSRYEGKAVTVGEAQILSKPVLITNYPTANSQVENGFDGWICESTIQGITEGILQLYTNIQARDRLINNCRCTNYENADELDKLYSLIN
jgi:glycosyltransferase involved in cell wall biosynthesis